jgi:hypothetical protein
LQSDGGRHPAADRGLSGAAPLDHSEAGDRGRQEARFIGEEARAAEEAARVGGGEGAYYADPAERLEGAAKDTRRDRQR